jgi:hypothetical protein
MKNLRGLLIPGLGLFIIGVDLGLTQMLADCHASLIEEIMSCLAINLVVVVYALTHVKQ